MLLFLFMVLLTAFSTNSLDMDEMITLFNNKHCIKGSLLQIDKIVDDITMIDVKSVIEGNSTFQSDKSKTSELHELAQHNSINHEYTLISEEGPAHAMIFTVRLVLGDETYEASGPSHQKAKAEVAALALRETFYKHPPKKIKEEVSRTPTVILNNIATKLGITVSYVLLDEKEQKIESYGNTLDPYGKSKSYYDKINSSFNSLQVPVEEQQRTGPFFVQVKVGDFTFKGFGHSIQAAKHDAALSAVTAMEKQALFKDNVCFSEDTLKECREMKESLKSPISRVNEASQKHNLPLTYTVLSEAGQSHQKVFVIQCRLGDFVTEGEGKSKKESKRVAAERMVEYLSHLPDIIDEKAISTALGAKKRQKQKKKKKMQKDAVHSIVDSVSQMASLLLDSSDNGVDTNSEPPPKKFKSITNNGNYKDKMLEVGRRLDFPVAFSDLPQKDLKFYSLMTLELKSPHVCFGEGSSREFSHEAAALSGLKFLQHFGVLEKTGGVTTYKQVFDELDIDFGLEEANKGYEETEKRN